MKSILVLIFILSSSAEARVFDFNKESIAAYLRGTGALSNVGDKAFSKSSGALTDVEGSAKFNFGGEFGVLFALAPDVSFRAGLELYQAKPVSDGKGKSSAGVEWFDLNSSVFSWGPVGTFEAVTWRGGSSRVFIYAGGGYASITMENEYTMTAAGATALSAASYTEKSEATSIFGFGGIGWETVFADATTIAFDIGYRYMPISKFTYKADTATIQGAKSKGGKVVNDDGSGRTLDMGGATMSVSLRFYIDLI